MYYLILCVFTNLLLLTIFIAIALLSHILLCLSLRVSFVCGNFRLCLPQNWFKTVAFKPVFFFCSILYFLHLLMWSIQWVLNKPRLHTEPLRYGKQLSFNCCTVQWRGKKYWDEVYHQNTTPKKKWHSRWLLVCLLI